MRPTSQANLQTATKNGSRRADPEGHVSVTRDGRKSFEVPYGGTAIYEANISSQLANRHQEWQQIGFEVCVWVRVYFFSAVAYNFRCIYRRCAQKMFQAQMQSGWGGRGFEFTPLTAHHGI